jgi:heme-degrading monooxygenase HmoA
MMCVLTHRTLKPGAWEAFREAWQPETYPPGFLRAYHLRSVEDPDQVISFGLFEGTAQQFAGLRDDPAMRAEQERRLAAMAPHVASIGVDGAFEVVDEVTPG